MFGRKSSSTSVVETQIPPKQGGKGHATPKRRDQEAANKARAKTPQTRKERAEAMRLQRLESQGKARQAMRSGDDRFLPARDRGPVKRFVRDWVDSHFMVAEIMLPLLIVVMALGFVVKNRRVALVSDTVVLLVIVVVAVNAIAMRFALRRELRKRFPDQSYAGTTYYAILRSTQVRFLRMPKPQVKMGADLPATYK